MNVDDKLAVCYEILKIAMKSDFLNARGVRAGYTHWIGPEISGDIRIFTGKVSQAAIQLVLENKSTVGLVFEHHKRMQTQMTSLIKKHMKEGEDLAEFIRVVKQLEEVNIVTRQENDQLRKSTNNGDYESSGIALMDWKDIPEESKFFLRKKLGKKVVNADQFGNSL